MAKDKKKTIIQAAKKSFSLYGYKATTMDHVAKISKVGKATIYMFFSTKEELFQEIINDLAQEMKEVAAEEIDRNLPFSINLHRSISKVLEFQEQHILTLKLFQEVREYGTPASIGALARLEEELMTFIEKEVEYALAKGELKQCDPKLTSFIIYKMYISLVHVWSVKHERLSKEELANVFNLYLIRGLGN